MLADLRFALRQLVKAPAFTAVALLTLAVGIGSATIVFSAVNAYLLRPLPLLDYKEDRLLYATQTNLAHGQERLGWSFADFTDLRARMTTLDGLWIHADRTVILGGKAEPVRFLGTEITWDAFTLMGVQPALGRAFTAADGLPGAPEVALVSDAAWRRHFNADPDIVGTTTILNGRPVTVVGVMPARWRYPDFSDVWTPLRIDAAMGMPRGAYYFSGRARLKAGVTLAEAQLEADTVMGALALAHPDTNSGISVRFRPIREEAIQETSRFVGLLFGAVLFVFLIACVNVANLLLARSVTRGKEIAIRLALGVTRTRIVRQLITESLLLALLGGVGGMVLALWGNDALIALIPVEIPFWLCFDFDLRVFGFVAGLSVIAAFVFGLIPALKVSQPDLATELKEGGRSADSGGHRASRVRNALVIIEVALALVLLVGAGLMMRSFLHLRSVDPGFDESRVLTFRTGLPSAMAGENNEVPARFFADLLVHLRALPGIESAGVTSVLPGIDSDHRSLALEGTEPPKRLADAPLVNVRVTSPGYFRTVSIPLVAGRLHDDTVDRPDRPRTVLVDESLATRHFGSVPAALGRRVRLFDDKEKLGAPAEPWLEIVGVVGNIRHRLDRDELSPTLYLSSTQTPANFLSVVIRTTGDPAQYAQAARETVLAVNPAIPIYNVLTLKSVVLRTVWSRQFFSHLFTVFGVVALFLACIGIYGVVAYSVTQRTQEIGVRMAMGAQSGAVVGMIIRRGLTLIGWGLGAGFVSALLLANLLSSVLYGVSPHDPPTFALVPLLLAAVALVACWLPSRRATLIDPNAAIRAG